MSILKNENIFTDKQGQYLAYIHYYSKVNRIPPAQRDMQKFFGVSPATVHQMILQLEKKNFIKRMPNTSRSFVVIIPEEQIPTLK